MRKFYLLFVISFIIIACSDNDKVPKGILPRQKMQEVLWDMISAGELLNGYILNKDSVDKTAASSIEFGRVLQFHHITKEEFEKSYLYYRQHPVLMKVVLDSLSKRQTPPEELFKPKSDTVKLADTSLKRADSIKLKRRVTQPAILKRDSTRKRILKKFRPRA
jgi:hypothetical protein